MIEMWPHPENGCRFAITIRQNDSWLTRLLARLGLIRPAREVTRIWEVTSEPSGGHWVA